MGAHAEVRFRFRHGWRAVVWLFTPALALGASACGPEPSDLDGVRAAGFVRAAYAHEPPYAYLDEVGEVAGESPVALRGALALLDMDSIRWERMSFEELLPALQQGRVDVVASGLYPSDERRELGIFTRSTSCASAALAIRRQGGATPASLEDFVDMEGDMVLAVMRGAVEERAARQLAVPAERLLLVPDPATGLEAVRRGRADAFALTEPSLRRALAGSADLEMLRYEAPAPVAGVLAGCSALAVRRDAGDFARALDAALERYVGSAEHRRQVEPMGFSVPDPVMRTTGEGGPP